MNDRPEAAAALPTDEDGAGTPAPASAEVGPQSLGYSYYVVAVLSVAYMLSFMDRTLISLLSAPIKAEFALTDTQLGVLIGFGFVLLYSVLGLPFGALADRTSRRWLMRGRESKRDIRGWLGMPVLLEAEPQ